MQKKIERKIILSIVLSSLFLSYGVLATLTLQNNNIQDFQKIKEERQQEFQARRLELQQEVQQLREEIKERIQAKKEAFQEKLQQIRDERKRTQAQNLSDNINKLNENLCNRYDGYLNALTLVLDKIENRAKKISQATTTATTTINLTSFYQKLNQARQAIEEAREKIVVQKSKVYIVEIESEETLKTNFQTVIRQLKDDHQNLRENVLSKTRNLVRDVIQALKDALPKNPNATST